MDLQYHYWVGLVDFYFKLPSLIFRWVFTTTGLVWWILTLSYHLLHLDGFLPPLGWFGGFFTSTGLVCWIFTTTGLVWWIFTSTGLVCWILTLYYHLCIF